MPKRPKKPHFARALVRLRKEAGLTVYALAQRSGISQQALRKMEAGVADPRSSTLYAVAHALGCTPDDLADPAWKKIPADGEL